MDVKSIGGKLGTVFSTREGKLLLIIALVALALNFSRLYTNCFWGDEAYSINVARYNIIDTITYELNNDIHPPLYHIIMSIFCNIFGFSPFMYHFVSFLPYLFIILISATYIYKKYGFATSVILIILASFMSTSLFYIVEARMYEWGLFFVFCSFILLREVLENPNKKNMCLFVLSSICAAYTHHYCLLAISFFYLVLLIHACCNRSRLKNTIIIIAVSILAYLPWLPHTLNSVDAVSKDFWVTTVPDAITCVSSLFGSKYGNLLFVIMLISVFFYLIFKFIKDKSIESNPETIWISTGLLTIIGTIAVSIIFSNLVRPVVLERYLYPISIIAWLLLAHTFPKFGDKKIIIAVIIIFIGAIGISNCVYTINMDYEADGFTNNVLDQTSEITSDDTIYTNINHMNWTMIDYYYPGTTHYYVEEFPTLGDKDTYWLIIENGPSDELTKKANDQGFKIELKVYDMFASYVEPDFTGHYDVYAYKLTRVC